MLYEWTMAPIRKPKPTKRRRARTTAVPRRKIPDRVQVNARVPASALRAFDDAWQRACETRPDPGLNRTDALLEAMALWVAAEAAKGTP